jgi:3'-phosphoadenosine 5'-phosphosulfate (PAPS) 3'-phosphatase
MRVDKSLAALSRELQAHLTSENEDMQITPAQEAAIGMTAEDIAYVLRLCRSLGTLAVGLRDVGLESQTKSGPEDIVTTADKALSFCALQDLGARFPNCILQSEESPWSTDHAGTPRRLWIDPVDGTKYFAKSDPHWSVMIGLEQASQLLCGWFALPDLGIVYCGGPAIGAYGMLGKLTTKLAPLAPLVPQQTVRVLVSKNDLAANQWLTAVQGLEIVTATSIGSDLHEIISGNADVFVHIRPTLKYWDTVSPGAVALGLSMEVGTEYGAGLEYGIEHSAHERCVVIGRAGALDWWAQVWSQREALTAAASAPATTSADAAAPTTH